MILPSWLASDGLRRPDNPLQSPGTAALREQPATWAQEDQPGKQFVVVKDPVERRGGEDDIDRLGQAQVEQPRSSLPTEQQITATRNSGANAPAR